MAFSITNFNQQTQDRQKLLLERMRGLCPQTANIGERLSLLPVLPEQVRVTENGAPAGPVVDGMSLSDHQMIGADLINAQNAKGLTAILGQACAREMEQGPATLPPLPANRWLLNGASPGGVRESVLTCARVGARLEMCAI